MREKDIVNIMLRDIEELEAEEPPVRAGATFNPGIADRFAANVKRDLQTGDQRLLSNHRKLITNKILLKESNQPDAVKCSENTTTTGLDSITESNGQHRDIMADLTRLAEGEDDSAVAVDHSYGIARRFEERSKMIFDND